MTDKASEKQIYESLVQIAQQHQVPCEQCGSCGLWRLQVDMDFCTNGHEGQMFCPACLRECWDCGQANKEKRCKQCQVYECSDCNKH